MLFSCGQTPSAVHKCGAARTVLSLLFGCWVSAAVAGTECRGTGVELQVLGSGGPELGDERASTSYLVWHDGQARLLVDMGSGSLLNFERSGASLADLDLLLFTHFHVDHSSDLPALVKASYFTGRDQDLPLFGPDGNPRVPGAGEFVDSLLGPQGAWPYLQDYLDGSADWRLRVSELDASSSTRTVVFEQRGLKASYAAVHHGPIPALAWRVELGGRSLAFSGDTSGRGDSLTGLAAGVDLLVAHNAVPEKAGEAALSLHMPPSRIGQIAADAGARKLLLSHRMRRTLGQEAETLAEVRRRYDGPVSFAEDLTCLSL
jgi:ribonuclease BN (tRNA processing enzyme)